MKTLLLASATLALLIAVNFSPAMAQEPKPSGETLGPASRNAWTPALQTLP
jgi:hypothetical protein